MNANYPAKTYLLGIIITLFITSLTYAQVGINTTSPSNGSMLDVTSTDKGMLVPRVDIANLSTIDPITGGSTESLLVYNTNTTTGKGFYFWNGTKWIGLDGENDWKLDGNSGTNESVNFVGTTDSEALTFRTNDIERFRIANGDQVQAMGDGSIIAPFYSWEADPTMGFYKSGVKQMSMSINGDQFFNANSNEPTVEWTFNPGGDDINLRVETDGNANALFVDGLNDNVGLGTNSPNLSSQLHLAETTKGLLINRVSLTATNLEAPVSTPAIGLLVFNVVTAGSGSTGVFPGFYYWDGSQWIAMGGTNGKDWALEGNAGTTAGTNFIGTTDAQDLILKVNSVEKIRVGATETVVNEDSNDYDFRVESNLEENLFLVNANEDQVFIKGTTQHLGYIDALSAYANSVGSATIGIQYAIAGWNQGNQGGGGNFVIEDATNPFAAMEASTEGTGIASRGLITSVTSSAIATSGETNSPNGIGVLGSSPTSFSGGTGFAILSIGDLGYTDAVYSVSDENAKKEIKEISSALDKIKNINGVTYKYDDRKFNPNTPDDNRIHYGFLASNIRSVMPEAVAKKNILFRNEIINARSTKDEMGTETILDAVNYQAIIPVLVEAMKEQQTQIEELKAKIIELER